jgi:hypothetical protein
MAEYGEWNRKGAVLSDKTATKEFGITREFIIEGIRAGKLEYRHGSVWGNPYLRVLRGQLEAYIAERMGEGSLRGKKEQAELRKVKKQIADLERQLAELRVRRAQLEPDVPPARPAHVDAAADTVTG